MRRQFKIIGQIGEPNQKDKLSYTSLLRQIEAGVGQGLQRPMTRHDKEIEEYKEHHCVLRVKRVEKTAAYTVLFVVPTITSLLDETTEEGSPVVQPVTRSRQQ